MIGLEGEKDFSASVKRNSDELCVILLCVTVLLMWRLRSFSCVLCGIGD